MLSDSSLFKSSPYIAQIIIIKLEPTLFNDSAIPLAVRLLLRVRVLYTNATRSVRSTARGIALSVEESRARVDDDDLRDVRDDEEGKNLQHHSPQHSMRCGSEVRFRQNTWPGTRASALVASTVSVAASSFTKHSIQAGKKKSGRGIALQNSSNSTARRAVRTTLVRTTCGPHDFRHHQGFDHRKQKRIDTNGPARKNPRAAQCMHSGLVHRAP